MAPILGIWASSRATAADTGAMFPLQVVTVGPAGASSVSFTNIPNTYTHLQIRGIFRATASGTTPLIRLNSDSGNNYAWHRLRGSGTAADAQGYASQPQVAFLGSLGLPSATSTFGAAIIDILDYANTNKYKTLRILDGADLNGSGNIELTSGLWQSTSAVTSFSITCDVNSFAENSQFALYAVKAAS